MGPTASGKSALAMALAEKMPVEIISVDATQVYRGLDIGSAKPSLEEQQKVPHHLIDICDPAEPYSVAEFREDALVKIDAIIARDKTPLLVGGTMMYFKSLLEGLADLPSGDASIRADIEQEAAEKGWPELHRQLAEVDPESAARLHPNHSQRIARALEVYRLTGQSLTQLHQQQKAKAAANLQDKYTVCQLALDTFSRSTLHQRIAQRFEQMLQQGFEAEVRDLRARGDLTIQLPAIRSVGYRQMWEYLTDEITYADMVEKGLAATRQLAKRQCTWLRSWDNLHHLECEDSQGQVLQTSHLCNMALKILSTSSI